MIVSQLIEIAKTSCYARRASPKNNYWVDFSKAKLDRTLSITPEDNLIIIIYSELDSDEDYYVIPYSIVKPAFREEYTVNDSSKRSERWIASIKNHSLKITNYPHRIDLHSFYVNPSYSAIQLETPLVEESMENEYAIENSRQELNVRLRQSKFRSDVLFNFDDTCCICGVTEKNLLIASHIVPWADNKRIRLDPSNGLCLFVLYDGLFDKGYFTLSRDYKIIIPKDISGLSMYLQTVLTEIEGRSINIPKKDLSQAALNYHRKTVFIDNRK